MVNINNKYFPIVFLFSGHGTQYYQMGIELYNNQSTFNKWMDYQDNIVKELGGYSILETLYKPSNRKSDIFDSIQYTHISLFMTQYALAQCMIEKGIIPQYVIGTSLGEYVGLAVSEVLSLREILKILLLQVELLKGYEVDGGMLSILDDYDTYSNMPAIINNSEIAAINSKKNFVISGKNGSLKEIESMLQKKGICYRLPIRYPFHSSSIDSLKEAHFHYYKQIKFKPPKIPIVSCAECRQVTEISDEYLWSIIRKPIMFMDTIKMQEKKGPFVYIDMSPSATLTNFMKYIFRDNTESKVYKIFSPFNDEENNNYLKIINEFKVYESTKGKENKMKAVVFTGQGSQCVGMGGNLFDEFKEITEKADSILGYSIKELCLHNSGNNLDKTEYTQPAIYVVNALNYFKLQKEGIEPSFLAGHSLGEYNALLASGAFSFEDGLRMVIKRGKLMAQAALGGMSAVLGLSQNEIMELFQKGNINSLDIANYNSSTQITVAGPIDSLEKLGKLVEDYGRGRCIPLRVSGAFHSRYMTDAKEAFDKYLDQFTFNDIRIPVIANYTAVPYQNASIQNILANQINHSVKWVESVQYMLNEGVEEFEEVGGNVILTKMIEEIRRTYLVKPKVKTSSPLVPDSSIHNKTIVSNNASEVGPLKGFYSTEFMEDYGIKYPYVCGGMYHGITSVEMVVRAAKAGMLAYFGTGGLGLGEIKEAIARIRKEVKTGYGVNFTPHQLDERHNDELIQLFLDNGVHNIEASGFIHIIPSIVKFRLKGLIEDTNGKIIAKNKVMHKVSRPEIVEIFINPAPQNIVDKLLEAGEITREEARLSQKIALANDICVEQDSGGHTDQGCAFVLLPTIQRMVRESNLKNKYTNRIRVGLAGGIGTPEAVATAFLLGAEFIVTGSINQCTVEAGTSNVSKDLLCAMNIQDTEYAPAGDMFELGAKVQVLKKGVFFPSRAIRLYETYKFYNSINDIDAKLKSQIQNFYFEKSFDEVYNEIQEYYGKRFPEELERAEKNQKYKMSLIFRQYFRYSTKAALEGELSKKVNYQILCGPSLGAFNQWVKNTELADWRKRHVDEIGLRLMEEAAEIIKKQKSLFI